MDDPVTVETCPCCGLPFPDIEDLIFDQERGLVILGGLGAPLTPEMQRLFAALYETWPRVQSKQQLYDALYWRRADGEQPEIKIVDVWICKLRAVLCQLDISIETTWGRGYSLRLPIKQGADR